MCNGRLPAHLDLNSPRPPSPGPHVVLKTRSPAYVVRQYGLCPATSLKDAVVEQRISSPISLRDSAWSDFERCACYSAGRHFYLILVCIQQVVAFPLLFHLSLFRSHRKKQYHQHKDKEIFLARNKQSILNENWSTQIQTHHKTQYLFWARLRPLIESSRLLYLLGSSFLDISALVLFFSFSQPKLSFNLQLKQNFDKT